MQFKRISVSALTAFTAPCTCSVYCAPGALVSAHTLHLNSALTVYTGSVKCIGKCPYSVQYTCKVASWVHLQCTLHVQCEPMSSWTVYNARTRCTCECTIRVLCCMHSLYVSAAPCARLIQNWFSKFIASTLGVCVECTQRAPRALKVHFCTEKVQQPAISSHCTS